MSKGVRVTKAVVVSIVLLIGVYDVIALFVFGVEATVSRVLGVSASFDAPTIPFTIGFVMGHLFWPQKKAKSETH